ncbi:MAG TPA: hypothetical protein VFY38_09265 [Pseudonocardia sp.]|nr:hypothetical protein [Pseudonocardia sp.]
MDDRTAHDPFSRFAAELSHNLPLITRLLAEHPRTARAPGVDSLVRRALRRHRAG